MTAQEADADGGAFGDPVEQGAEDDGGGVAVDLLAAAAFSVLAAAVVEDQIPDEEGPRSENHADRQGVDVAAAGALVEQLEADGADEDAAAEGHHQCDGAGLD